MYKRRAAYTKLTALCKSDPAVASLPKSADANFFVLPPVKMSFSIVGGSLRRKCLVAKLLLDIRDMVHFRHVGSDEIDSMRDRTIAPVTR